MLAFSQAGQEVGSCLINLFAKAAVRLVEVDPAGLCFPRWNLSSLISLQQISWGIC